MITYALNDNGIFEVHFAGTILPEDIKHFLMELEQLKNLPANFISLLDLRGANLVLDGEDIAAISNLSVKITARYKTVKTALLVDKPILTAYSFLFSVDHNSEKITRLVFSNEEKALKWLK